MAILGEQPPTQTNSLEAAPDPSGAIPTSEQAPAPQWDDKALLELFQKLKKEAFDSRWVWEREWLRDLYYVSNRQWIFYHPTKREWVDKRLQKWIPRPVTNKMAEVLQAIRTNLGAIQLAVKARPIGSDTQSVSTAEIADQMSPLIHEEHQMNQVMREADFWLITTGNAVLQVSWDKDFGGNSQMIPFEECLACGTVSDPQSIVTAGNACPACGNTQLAPATDETGAPIGEKVTFGKGKTVALSPFEYAFPANVTRWDDLPYIIRIRWRDKHWIERNAPELVNKIKWEKSPSDKSLQIFKSLAITNDVGGSGNMGYLGNAGSSTTEGITEYELWLKPTPDFPDGLVMRVLGDKDPIILHQEETEGLPGPMPYKDKNGSVLFPFTHAQYEHIGGRLLGRSAIAPLIQKQDQLNQLDSLIQLIIQRMANPVWVVPDGAGIEHFTGEPGLVMKWNPMAIGGTNAKPERLAGQEVPSTLYQLRQQILQDIEELSGAFDIIKGQKPTGIEAFSALQLLVERSQSRFTSVFQSRGEMYRNWFAIAIELERQFGPEERVWAVIGPNRGYSFQHFQNAQLQGQITFQIEDGSNMPKTALGKRAAIEQANQLMLLDPADPDQRYALLTNFGLSDLVPSLNIHVQAALQVQDEFEKWALSGMGTGPSPLVIKPWFDVKIHWSERIKWLNSDKMKGILTERPELEQEIVRHLQELQMYLIPPAPAVDPATGLPADGGAQGPDGGPKPQGGALAARNSNQNSASTKSLPKGNKQTGPSVGPA